MSACLSRIIPCRGALIIQIASIQVILQNLNPVSLVIWICVTKLTQVSETRNQLVKYLEVPLRVTTASPVLFAVLLKLSQGETYFATGYDILPEVKLLFIVINV